MLQIGELGCTWKPFLKGSSHPSMDFGCHGSCGLDLVRLGGCFHASAFNLVHIKQSALSAFQGLEGLEGSFPDSFYFCLVLANGDH